MPSYSSIPFGELAPGLFRAGPEIINGLLETGEFVDFTDYRNACDEIKIHPSGASQAFGRNVHYLAQGVNNSISRGLYNATSWLSDNPTLGIRYQLLIGTQRLSTMVDEHQAKTFDFPPKIFTENHWRVMTAVIRGEFEIDLDIPEEEPEL